MLVALANGEDISDRDEHGFQKLREELTEMVEAVHFHNAKIEYLVDQLYSYNRRLTTLGGQNLRLSERHKEMGRASCRERVCRSVWFWVVAVALIKKR